MATYAEIVGVGGLPLLISLLCRDRSDLYGVSTYGLDKSLGLSIPLALALKIVLYNGMNVESFGLQFPYNVYTRY